MMISISNYILFGFTEWVKALQHVYAYMDVGGRATQEQLPSSPVLPAWLCEIIAPARPALAIFVHPCTSTH